MKLLTGAALAASLMAAGHWMPTAEPYKRPSVPRRIFAYVYGVAGILLGVWVATDGRTAAKALAVSAAAGAATVGVYAIDAVLHGRDA